HLSGRPADPKRRRGDMAVGHPKPRPGGSPRTMVEEASGRWPPLLVGVDRDQAIQLVRSIALDLEASLPSVARDPSLAGGQAGVALFFAYLALCLDDDRAFDLAARLTEEAYRAATEDPSEPSLYGGLAGVGWTLAHLEGTIIETGPDDPLEAFDR